MKIVTIIGARPQFVKASLVSLAIKEYNQHSSNEIQEIIVHTGQHFDANMSEIFFDQMNIPQPHYHLGINSLSHGAMTGQMLEKIENVLINERPDWVLVYGDTNSTVAGALAAKKLHIKVAHVEAGLRSFNLKMPEEINRILTDRISDILFCPTTTAIENLKNEGFLNLPAQIVRTGDIMLDAAIHFKKHSEKPDGVHNINFILVTIHRAENTDDPLRMEGVVTALNTIASEKAQPVVLPLHPRTKKIIEKLNLKFHASITVIDPVGYLQMIWLISNCQMVMTDSGGLQKEAFFFRKPCVTLRNETEWVELVEAKVNVLAGADPDLIIRSFENFCNAFQNFDLPLYGDGNTRNLILESLINYRIE